MSRRLNYALGSGWEFYVASHCRCLKNEFELSDGSLVRFSGPTGQRDAGVDFTYVKTPTKNTVKNILDPVAHSVFDFTYLTDQNGQLELILKNEDLEDFDVLSLANMVGLTDVEVLVGEYDEGTQSWVSYESSSYKVPYEVLNTSSISGNTIILEDAERWSDSSFSERIYPYAS